MVICTADKDARQLLDDSDPDLEPPERQDFLDVEGLKADWGVRLPSRLSTPWRLTGDYGR